MANFLNNLKSATNYTYTENGAVTHKSTLNELLDLFGMGAAYRNRSDASCIMLFKKAYDYNPVYAMKCLFYLRDVHGGQGERRFFRVVTHWLADRDPEAMRRNLVYVSEFGRWDDLYTFVGTKLEEDAFKIMRKQFMLDLKSMTPSLLGKWLKSENTSSADSRALAHKTRLFFNMTHREYRVALTKLRARIKVLEQLMSENRWDEIEFDKIPSKAGLKYRNAFARRDVLKARYEAFAKDSETKVNAKTLYPYECVGQAIKLCYGFNQPSLDNTQRLMVNKYWDNLTDYFNEQPFNGIAVVDTSGSMIGTPMNVAISLGLYCAEKARGPFANHYITFSRKADLVETSGVDFCDKVYRIFENSICENTNIESVFHLLLDTAIMNNCSQEDLPQNVIIISDMEFDQAVRCNNGYVSSSNAETLLEGIAREWLCMGYEMPHLIFWNVDARQDNIPMIGRGRERVSYVSGMSPVIFETIMSGKTGADLMYEKLDSERYACIR